MASRTGSRAAWACWRGSEGLDGLGQGTELVGVGGPADGVEDGVEAAWACSGVMDAEGLDELGQGLERPIFRGLADGVEDGAEGGLGLLGGELGVEGLDDLDQDPKLVGWVVRRMVSRTGVSRR